MAEKELPKVNAAGLALPGDFNRSASAIFSGAHAGVYTGDKAWAQEEGMQLTELGLRDEEARIKFKTGIAIMGTDEQCDLLLDGSKAGAGSLSVLSRISASLEIIDIQTPTESTREAYELQSKIVQDKLGPLEPLGKLICKTWFVDDCDEWDLPKDKYPSGKPERASAGADYEFWVEESVLSECFVGMKMDAEIMKLERGIMVLDEVHEAMCSFFTWLPNELWMERKPKEVRWLKKALAEDEESGDEEEKGGEEFDDE